MNLDQMFLDPERLWWLLLVPVLVIAYIYLSRRKNRMGMRFTNTSILGAVVPVQSQWRRHLAVALSLLSLVALTIAWSRPSGIDRVPRERATIVLVLDISQSMAATDVKPNRLDAAKTEAKRFVASIPATYNVALVSLSGNPAARMPPTTDRGQVNRAIDALTLQDSTAIGDAINVAMSTLQSAPKAADGSIPPGAIVLLSDGQNTAGRSPTQEAAAAAHDRLFALSLASEGSARIGGLLSTNAGGVNVLRYGSARDLCLGLEAVLPDGSILNGLKRLRKDNTGYDLKQLFIGAEGTLGIITAAVLKLFPLPAATATAWLAMRCPDSTSPAPESR